MVLVWEPSKTLSNKRKKLEKQNTSPFHVHFCKFIMKKFSICSIHRRWKKLPAPKWMDWRLDGQKMINFRLKICLFLNVTTLNIASNITIRASKIRLSLHIIWIMPQVGLIVYSRWILKLQIMPKSMTLCIQNFSS